MPLLKVNQIASYSGNTLTVGTTGDTVTLASGATSSGFGLTWNQTVQTTNFTASVGVGYMVNTSTASVTVTLPASPSIGDQIQLVDYYETAANKPIILNGNGLKIDGTTDNAYITNSGEGVTLMYAGTTRGWIPVLAANEGTAGALTGPYNIDFLVVGGGGGGGGYRAGGGGAGGYRTSTQAITPGTVITATVGDGGAGGVGGNVSGNNGSNGSSSSISGSGLTTITSAGGGGGGGPSPGTNNGLSGGSGGGGTAGSSGGTGNTPSTSPSQGNNGAGGTAPGKYGAGGGGGAGAVGSTGTTSVGGNGGNGTASSITGSSITYAGGGSGGAIFSAPSSTGGTGGGGNSPTNSNGTAGTANLGGGGGGANSLDDSTTYNGGAGGKGVVIMSIPTIHYSGNSSGSPTVTTSGSNTILTFTGSGTYTA